MESPLKQMALDKLSAPPSRASLLDLVRWLDLECAGAAPESLAQQLLARAIVAAGRGLTAKRTLTTVLTTIEAASAYVLKPTAERFDRYCAAATCSYPFGSGDGCYAVAELGYAGCEPGSGCASGAGSLACIAEELGAEVAMQLVAAELVPWLRTGHDAVKLRRPRSNVKPGA